MLADPRTLARWWPRVERVKAVTGEGWTTVLRSERGRALRADWRLEADDPPRRRAWGQELDGTPFAKVLAERHVEAQVEPAGEGTPGDAGAASAGPRDGAVRALHVAARGEEGARRRARRAHEGGLVRREQVFWGWGEPGAGPSLPEHAGGFLRDELGISGDVVDRPVSLDDVRLREPAIGSDVLRRLEADHRRRPDRPRGARAALPRQVLPRPARPARRRLRARPGRRRGARRPRPGARRAAGVQRGGRGGRAVRRRDERGRRPRAAARPVRGADLARPGPDGRADRPRRALAHRDARSRRAAAGGRPRARRPRAHARPRCRRATSGRRSAAASPRARPGRPRPATAGSTRTSSPSASPPRSASWRRATSPRAPPGRSCGSSWPAARGCSA